MPCRDRTPRKSQNSCPDLSLSARRWGSKISPGSEPYHRRVAIEVTGEVVAAGLAGAGLPVVVVNPAQCGEAAGGKANHRNGNSIKIVLTETSRIGIKIPCDREGTFDPKLIQRYQSRFAG